MKDIRKTKIEKLLKEIKEKTSDNKLTLKELLETSNTLLGKTEEKQTLFGTIARDISDLFAGKISSNTTKEAREDERNHETLAKNKETLNKDISSFTEEYINTGNKRYLEAIKNSANAIKSISDFLEPQAIDKKTEIPISQEIDQKVESITIAPNDLTFAPGKDSEASAQPSKSVKHPQRPNQAKQYTSTLNDEGPALNYTQIYGNTADNDKIHVNTTNMKRLDRKPLTPAKVRSMKSQGEKIVKFTNYQLPKTSNQQIKTGRGTL